MTEILLFHPTETVEWTCGFQLLCGGEIILNRAKSAILGQSPTVLTQTFGYPRREIRWTRVSHPFVSYWRSAIPGLELSPDGWPVSIQQHSLLFGHFLQIREASPCSGRTLVSLSKRPRDSVNIPDRRRCFSDRCWVISSISATIASCFGSMRLFSFGTLDWR